jgi:tryptophan 2,3-dioxygenase
LTVFKLFFVYFIYHLCEYFGFKCILHLFSRLHAQENLENDNKKLETDYKKLMEEFVETSGESSKGIDELRAELANRDDALKALRQSLEDKHRAELKSLQDKNSAVLSAEQSQVSQSARPSICDTSGPKKYAKVKTIYVLVLGPLVRFSY